MNCSYAMRCAVIVVVSLLASNLRADEKQLKDENQKLQKQIDELKKQVDDAKRNAGSPDAKVAELQKQNDDLRKQITALQQPQNRVDPNAQTAQTLQKQIDDLKKQLDDAKKPGAPSLRIAELEKQNDDLRKQLLTLQQQPKAADPNAQLVQKQIDDLRKNNDDLRKQLDDSKKTTAGVAAKSTDQMAALQKQSDDQKRQIEELQKNHADVQVKTKTQVTDLQTPNDQLRKSLEDSRRNADRSLQDQLALAQRQNTELSKQVDDLRRTNNAVPNANQNQNQNMLNQLTVLQQQNDDLTRQLADVRRPAVAGAPAAVGVNADGLQQQLATAQQRNAELDRRVKELSGMELLWPSPQMKDGVLDTTPIVLKRIDATDPTAKLLVDLPATSKGLIGDVDGPADAVQIFLLGTAAPQQRLVARIFIRDNALQLQWGPGALDKDRQAMLRRMVIILCDREGKSNGEVKFRPETKSLPLQ